MRVKVTKADIRKGRLVAKKTCGCPIWHALHRTLRNLTSADLSTLRVPQQQFATIPSWKILLPEEAQDFQQTLIDDFSADVQPFEFEAEVIPHGKKAA